MSLLCCAVAWWEPGSRRSDGKRLRPCPCRLAFVRLGVIRLDLCVPPEPSSTGHLLRLPEARADRIGPKLSAAWARAAAPASDITAAQSRALASEPFRQLTEGGALLDWTPRLTAPTCSNSQATATRMKNYNGTPPAGVTRYYNYFRNLRRSTASHSWIARDP